MKKKGKAMSIKVNYCKKCGEWGDNSNEIFVTVHITAENRIETDGIECLECGESIEPWTHKFRTANAMAKAAIKRWNKDNRRRTPFEA